MGGIELIKYSNMGSDLHGSLVVLWPSPHLQSEGAVGELFASKRIFFVADSLQLGLVPWVYHGHVHPLNLGLYVVDDSGAHYMDRP